MSALAGATVALFESRMAAELAGLVERHGGRAHQVPAVREVALTAAESASVVDRVVGGEFGITVALTGVGIVRLFEHASERGLEAHLAEALRRTTIVCRGPKPVAALKSRGVTPTVLVPSPHTTDELLATLAQVQVRGEQVLVTHAGQVTAEPAAALRARGAEVADLQLYRWELPAADAARLREFVVGLALGRGVGAGAQGEGGGAASEARSDAVGEISAVAFTTQVQVRHLFQEAEHAGVADRLRAALSERVVVAAVGPTCAEALRSFGVVPDVEPAHPKMGQMVVALARYWEAHGGKAARLR